METEWSRNREKALIFHSKQRQSKAIVLSAKLDHIFLVYDIFGNTAAMTKTETKF